MNKEGELFILHISDLHRDRLGSPARLSNESLWASLGDDIEHRYRKLPFRSGEPRLPLLNQIDLAIVTGDLTYSASEREFTEAEQFLNRIVNRLFDGDRERVIVVPGNHDIDWKVSKAAFEEVELTTDIFKQAREPGSCFRIVDDLTGAVPVRKAYELIDRNKHAERLDEFSRSIGRFFSYKHSFPKQEASQFSIHEFMDKLGVIVVGFNSCHTVDRYSRRGSICNDAIVAASARANDIVGRRSDVLRIAAWHHDVLGDPSRSDFMDPKISLLLADHGFSVGLHGHIHDASRLELQGRGEKIRLICAGTLAAGPRSRSGPMLYNVVGISRARRKGWCHVRQRIGAGGPWTPHTGAQGSTFYTFDIPLEEDGAPEQRSDVIKVSQSLRQTDFLDKLAQNIRDSSEIVFAGIALTILNPVIDSLICEEARDRGLNARIYFGNVNSEEIKLRLAAEAEHCPPEQARDEISVRLRSIRNQARHDNVTEYVDVRVFDFYPLMTIYRFTREGTSQYYFYPMGYYTLGSDCAAFHVRGHDVLARFLDKMIEKIHEHSVEPP